MSCLPSAVEVNKAYTAPQDQSECRYRKRFTIMKGARMTGLVVLGLSPLRYVPELKTIMSTSEVRQRMLLRRLKL